MYIHFKTIGITKMGGKVNKYSFEDFKNTLAKHPKLGKVDVKNLLKELYNFLDLDKSNFINFDFKKLFDDINSENDTFYFSVKNLLDYTIEEICRKTNVDTNNFLNCDDLIKEFDMLLHRNTPSYNFVLCASILYRILPKMNSDNKEDKPYNLFVYLTSEMLKNKAKIHSVHIKELNNKVVEVEKIKTKLNQKNEEIKRLNQTIKEINKDKRFFEQNLNNNNIKIKDSLEDINRTIDINAKLSIEYMLSELKSYKVNIIENAYEGIIDRLNTTISDLKISLRNKTYENKKLKDELKIKNNNEVENIKIEDILKKSIEDNGITKDILEVLKEYTPYIGSKCEDNTNNTDKITKATLYERIGYCNIVGDIHFARFTDGSLDVIKNIPEGIYLAEGQFVLVNQKNEFKYAYQSYCNEGEIPPNSILVSVSSVDDDVALVRHNDTNHLLLDLPDDKVVKPMQVLAVDKDYRYLRHFTKMYQSADNLFSSIRAKGHKAYFVLNIENNKFELRNIENEVSEIKELNVGKYEIKIHSVITVNINIVVSYFPTGRFYTFSTYYNNSSYAIINSISDMILANRVGSDNLFEISDMPNNLPISIGDVVKVDEFNKLIDVLSFKDINNKAKKRLNKKTYQSKSIGELDNIKKSILIIGNLSYRNAYRSTFRKHNYQIEVIDGYESWAKINKSLKNIDLAVIVTGFCSHDNMWKLKDNDVPTIFSEYDGANRLLEQVEYMYV